MPTTIIEAFPREVKTVRAWEEDNPAILKVAECFADTVQGENSVGIPSVFLRLQGCTLNCSWCFHPNTKIDFKSGQNLIDGRKRIKDVKIGDILWTLDPEKGIVETEVKEVISHDVPIEEIMQLRFNGSESQMVVCTKKHKFFVKNSGWVEAGELNKDDIILNLDVSKRMKHKNPVHGVSKQILADRAKEIFTGREQTINQRQLNSVKHLGGLNPMKDPEVARRSAQNRFGGQSKLESKFEKIFKESNLPIKYVGNNKLPIGDKKNRYRFPDFQIEGKNKLIEIFHTNKIGNSLKYRDKEWKTQTSKFYEKFGFDTLFLTEKDLALSNRTQLQDKLFNFVFNGEKVTEVTYKFSDHQKASLFGSKDCKMTTMFNLSCSPHNTYLVMGKLVHNCDTEEVWRKGNPYNVTELLDLWNMKWLVDDTRTDTSEEASNARSIVDRLREGHHLILTGGSPLKQQDGLIALISEFQTRFGFKPYIEIENECTLVPKDEIVAIVDLWNNSPKLANNGMKRLVRYKPGIIRYLSTLNSHFKFVISEAADWDEIVKDFIEPGLIKKHQIVLMPEGATREDLHKNYQKVVDIAVREDLRMTDRLHVTIWDKATGV